MKTAIRGIVGKTVECVVISERNKGRPPRDQIFLVFTDGTYFEIYGDLKATGGIDPGGEEAALQYAKQFDGEITVYSADPNVDSSAIKQPDSPRDPPPGERASEDMGDTLAELLRQAVQEIEAHDSDYHYQTTDGFIEKCDAALDPTGRNPRPKEGGIVGWLKSLQAQGVNLKGGKLTVTLPPKDQPKK